MRHIVSVSLLVAFAATAAAAQVKAPASSQLDIPLAHKKREELKLKHDSFTFVRIKYSGSRAGRARGRWMTDYPDSDIALSARLEIEIGLKTDPKGIVLELTDAKLKEYPFAYLVEGGSLQLSRAEADALRGYLDGGGFLLVDDFWGEAEWTSLQAEIKKAFPEYKVIDLPLEHPVFHSFYEIREKPQVPSIALALTRRNEGITWERADGRIPHYRGLVDRKGRLLAIFCHNTDLGDGWEREGADDYYTQEFSLKRAFPMGINIVVFALSQ